MNNYQVDRRDGNGNPDGYDIIKAHNFDEALKNYLKEDYTDYKFDKKHVNGKIVITASCPEETAGYLEISKI